MTKDVSHGSALSQQLVDLGSRSDKKKSCPKVRLCLCLWVKYNILSINHSAIDVWKGAIYDGLIVFCLLQQPSLLF